MTTFSARQKQVMDGISRGLSYAEIGAEIHASKHTVRAHVAAIALKIRDFPDLAPRYAIFAYMKQREWEASHAPGLPKSA